MVDIPLTAKNGRSVRLRTWYWALNFVNPNNIGKQFYLDVYDKANGAVISQTQVTISG